MARAGNQKVSNGLSSSRTTTCTPTPCHPTRSRGISRNKQSAPCSRSSKRHLTPRTSPAVNATSPTRAFMRSPFCFSTRPMSMLVLVLLLLQDVCWCTPSMGDFSSSASRSSSWTHAPNEKPCWFFKIQPWCLSWAVCDACAEIILSRDGTILILSCFLREWAEEDARCSSGIPLKLSMRKQNVY